LVLVGAADVRLVHACLVLHLHAAAQRRPCLGARLDVDRLPCRRLVVGVEVGEARGDRRLERILAFGEAEESLDGAVD
jgi:hypothetical protein